MSDYCTNCTHLSKQSIANKTEWRCTHDRYVGYLLQSLCGNPTKLAICKEANWYLKKEVNQTYVRERGLCPTCNKPLTKTVAAGYVCYKCDDKFKRQEKTMNTKEMIEVIKAYEDKKQIQSRQKGTNIEFKDDNTPTFNFFCCDYRIKPTYRPYKPEEIPAELLDGTGWTREKCNLKQFNKITHLPIDTACLLQDSEWTWGHNPYKAVDWKPCGMLEE
jgi:hypothetical protein